MYALHYYNNIINSAGAHVLPELLFLQRLPVCNKIQLMGRLKSLIVYTEQLHYIDYTSSGMIIAFSEITIHIR